MWGLYVCEFNLTKCEYHGLNVAVVFFVKNEEINRKNKNNSFQEKAIVGLEPPTLGSECRCSTD